MSPGRRSRTEYYGTAVFRDWGHGGGRVHEEEAATLTLKDSQ